LPKSAPKDQLQQCLLVKSSERTKVVIT